MCPPTVPGQESRTKASARLVLCGSAQGDGEGNGNPLQYFCLENPVDREAWQAIVHWVAKSDMTEAT